MKRTWMTMIFAVAVTASAAMAQGFRGTVPFDFTAGGTKLAAGNYLVSRIPSATVAYTVRVRNEETKQSVLLVSTVPLDTNSSSKGNAAIVFQCNSNGCALAQVHTPYESAGRAFATPGTKRGDSERTVAIRLSSSEGAAGF